MQEALVAPEMEKLRADGIVMPGVSDVSRAFDGAIQQRRRSGQQDGVHFGSRL